MFPKKQVVIIAPPTIQQGWLREIFNMKRLILGTKEGMPNVHNGCTGNTYLKLSACEYERDVNVIRKRVTEVIKRRYKIYGYLQFSNYVKKYLAKNISKELKGERLLQEETRFLSKRFSGTLLIVDEAHNLRDKETVIKETTTVKPVPTVTAKPPTVTADEGDVDDLLDELGDEGLDIASTSDQSEGEGEGESEGEYNQGNVDRILAELEAENAAASVQEEKEEEEEEEEEENEIELTKQEGGANNNSDFDEEDSENEIELQPQERGFRRRRY
jgi:hypothetical protein